jgi:hypothetical protein
MAVVMGRKNYAPTRLEPTRKLLRVIETFSERVTVGTEVAGDITKPRQEAVKNAAKKFKRSERYVWGTVKLGAKLHAQGLEILKNVPPSPRFIAEAFLVNALGSDAKAAKEIEAQARKSGIAISTLRRASKVLRVKKRRIGGRHGQWSWELPLEVKKYFGIGV